MKSVFIQQPLLPHYRAPFFERLAIASPSYSFYLTYDSYPKKGFVPIKPVATNIFYLKSSWKLIRGIVFNFSILPYAFRRFDLYIFNDNVRSPALLIFLIINFLLCRRTLLWGHGLGTTHPGLGLILRRLFLYFTSGYISYSPEGEDLLKKLMPNKTIYLASNSLDTSIFLNASNDLPRQIFTVDDLEIINNSDVVLVYASRLEPEKHPLKLFDVINSLHRLDCRATLIVIGEGSLFDSFKKQINTYPALNSSIKLVGSITDPASLSYIFSFADFLVHPGVIGLTLQMSFCFSTPVITSINESHMPEFHMFENNFNGLLVNFDQPLDVASKIKSVMANFPLHTLMKNNCYNAIYSAEGINIERFVSEFTTAISSSVDS